ncbi:MAG TPA: UTP--glucose-1-phosphate uridylyltransferase GalU [Actinomycetota bacterium]|jgi:UTP--glucose-1-phosphate uridylyltransferase|nr:UTP--glucose-1-phosphate uridylyltransferase GalU [Actinomycetota bacterium]
MTVRKAVIPAAGLGTRFLPATKSQPKEMIPVVDKPGIQYVVEEAVRAGLDDILVVTSRGKITVEDHFDRSLELEHHLERTGKDRELEEVRRVAELADVHFVRQKEPLGFGHAVSVARHHIADQPFVVMVGDEIVPHPEGNEPVLVERMLEIFEERHASVVAVMDVPRENISAYGAVAGEQVAPDLVRLRDMVEKPSPDEAPSTLGSRGRYVFTPGIFDAIDKTSEGVGGEIQLTDAIKLLAEQEEVYAYVHHGVMYDVGKKLDYLKASIELALRRRELAEPFKEYLAEVAARLERR